MGTVMYSYRLAKDDFWPTLLVVRQYYLDNWPPLLIFREACYLQDGRSGAIETLRRVEEEVKDHEHLVDVQVFDEGTHYLIRPLEQGHFFTNNADHWPELVPVFYDTRTDDPRTDDPNPLTEHERRRTAEWTDKQIKLRKYLIYPLISKRDYADIAYWQVRRMVG